MIAVAKEVIPEMVPPTIAMTLSREMCILILRCPSVPLAPTRKLIACKTSDEGTWKHLNKGRAEGTERTHTYLYSTGGRGWSQNFGLRMMLKKAEDLR